MPTAVILERAPLVARRMSRVLTSTGLDVVVGAEPHAIESHLEASTLLVADEFDRDVAMGWLHKHPGLHLALLTAEPLVRCLKVANESRVVAVLGRPSFGQPPRDIELMTLGTRMQGIKVPFGAYMRHGASTFERHVASTADIASGVKEVETFVRRIEPMKWVSDSVVEVAHEMLMNAIYDAPVDASGQPCFAHDRRANVELPAAMAAFLRVGCDGTLLCIQVTDIWGRLTRDHVVGGLLRGLQSGDLDPSGGGAGIGITMCHNSTSGLIYEITPDRETEVTGILDLDLNRRTFRTAPRSLHFFRRE